MLLLPLRPVICFAPPLQAIFAPCGPLMGILTVMHFSHLLLQDRHFAPPPPPPPRAIDGCPPSDAILKSCSSITGKVAPRGPLMGVLAAMQFCPLWVRSVVVLPVRQPCPLRAFLVSCPSCEAAMPPAGLFGELSPLRGSHAPCGSFQRPHCFH